MGSDLALIVNGKRYGGWKSVRVRRSIESLAGSFDLDVSDRWGGQEVPWPILEEDACRVEIDGTVVIDGYVDQRRQSIAAESRTLSYSGRDRSAALVDNSAILEQWSFRNLSVLDVARKVAAPFGIKVSLQPGLVLPPPQAKLVVSPGDSPYQAILRAAAASGVLLVSDGAGGVLITRAGTARATTPLIEGENVKDASVEYNGTERFHRYVVATQVPGTDTASGEATRIRAEARDLGVRRTDRVLMFRPEAGLTTAEARRRGDWEARIRAARAMTVSVSVQGWKQPRGGLWPPNVLVHVNVPSIGVAGEQLLISEVEHGLDGGGEVTQLRLVRADAFSPEPVAAVVKAGPSPRDPWPELD